MATVSEQTFAIMQHLLRRGWRTEADGAGWVDPMHGANRAPLTLGAAASRQLSRDEVDLGKFRAAVMQLVQCDVCGRSPRECMRAKNILIGTTAENLPACTQ